MNGLPCSNGVGWELTSSDKEINGKPLILIENTMEINDFAWIWDCVGSCKEYQVVPPSQSSWI